jgi:hypothetical protein
VELTATHKNKIAKFDAMTAAHKAGHPEVVLMILNGQIGVRSRRSGEWPIRDYQREVPSGTTMPTSMHMAASVHGALRVAMLGYAWVRSSTGMMLGRAGSGRRFYRLWR